MKKRPIGIIDVTFSGITILNNLKQAFPYENFVYLNDIKNLPYEGKDVQVILKYVKHNVEHLLQRYNIKALIVISNTIIEYCEDYLNSLEIPVVYITKAIIDYVNSNYESKNMVLCGLDYVLKASLYQKNLRYNHLNTIQTNKMEEVLQENGIKTMKSFNIVNDSFKGIANKEFDILIYTAPWIELLKTELNEYVKVKDIIKLGDIINDAVSKLNIDFCQKRNGKIILTSTLLKNEYLPYIPWLDLKYKYKKAEIIYEQPQPIQENNPRI